MAVSDQEEFNEQRRQLFDREPGRYRDGRPGYPPAVFEALAEQCGLGPGCRVLEIGPGTGQATAPLLEAGAEVVAVELGAEMAAALADGLPSEHLVIKTGAFEEVALDADLQPERFDLVLSATAFHWVPQPVGFQRCHQMLKPSGHLGLWWNFFGDLDREDPFHEAIQPLLQAKAPELLTNASVVGANPYALDVAARTADIDSSGLFGPVTYTRVQWTGRHSGPVIRAMFGSFSPWLALEPEVREPLLDDLESLVDEEFDGVVERPYNTALYTAPRR